MHYAMAYCLVPPLAKECEEKSVRMELLSISMHLEDSSEAEGKRGEKFPTKQKSLIAYDLILLIYH
jgi:hypothetical protein